MDKMTMIRTIILVYSLINSILVMLGFNPIPFTEDEVGTAITLVLTVSATLWSWWKNNNFTHEAKEAQKHLLKMKHHAKKGSGAGKGIIDTQINNNHEGTL